MRDLQTRHRSSPWVHPLVRFHRAGGVPAPPGAQSHRASPRTQRLPPSISSITWTGGTVPRTPPALCQGIWGSRAHPPRCGTACEDEEGNEEKSQEVCRVRWPWQDGAQREGSLPSHSPLPVPGGPRAGCGAAGRLRFGGASSCWRPMCGRSCPCPLTQELRSRGRAPLAASPPHSSASAEPAGAPSGSPAAGSLPARRITARGSPALAPPRPSAFPRGTARPGR